MTLALILIAIAAWIFWNGSKFYRQMNWNEPAESSPDFKAMHKKQAQLLHIQEFIEEAHKEGKVSAEFLKEYNQFLEKETQAISAAESAWKHRSTP
jgi:hypothetical protein